MSFSYVLDKRQIYLKNKETGEIDKEVIWVDSTPYNLDDHVWSYSKHIDSLILKK